MTDKAPRPEPTELTGTDLTGTGLTGTGSSIRHPRARHGRRVLAVVAGVAMVPALYAAASAVTGGGERPSLSVAAHGADDLTGTEVETEHGVTAVKPDRDGVATPPSPTTPTTPTLPGSDDRSDDDSATSPTTSTVPEREPDDDRSSAPAPAGPVTRTFTSVGGSIEVTFADGVLSLGPVTPAAGWTPEVHDVASDRVEVRFSDAEGQEWRIRVEVAGGAMTQEITFHG